MDNTDSCIQKSTLNLNYYAFYTWGWTWRAVRIDLGTSLQLNSKLPKMASYSFEQCFQFLRKHTKGPVLSKKFHFGKNIAVEKVFFWFLFQVSITRFSHLQCCKISAKGSIFRQQRQHWEKFSGLRFAPLVFLQYQCFPGSVCRTLDRRTTNLYLWNALPTLRRYRHPILHTLENFGLFIWGTRWFHHNVKQINN